MTPDERIQRVETTVQRLISEIERVPGEELYRSPSDGEWSVMKALAHLEELLPYWARQAAAISAVPGAAFGRTHEDPDRIRAVETHGQDRLEDMVPRLRASLDECLRTLRGLPGEAWTRAGLHPRRGSMTVEQVVEDLLVSHAEEHAAQIRASLASGRPSRRS